MQRENEAGQEPSCFDTRMNSAASRTRRALRAALQERMEREAEQAATSHERPAAAVAAVMGSYAPEKLPDPWLYDSACLLLDLDRVRELILQIPLTAASYSPANVAIAAVWDLREKVRYLLGLHAEMQRSWQKKHGKAVKHESAPRGQPQRRPRPARPSDADRPPRVA